MDTPTKSSPALINYFATGYRRFFLIAILTSAASIMFNFLMPQIIRFSVDYIVGSEPLSGLSSLQGVLLDALGGRDYLRSHFIVCALGIILCTIMAGVCNHFSRVSIARGNGGFTKKLRDTLFTHIQHLPYKWHTDNQTGDIIQRCTFDVEQVQSFVSAQLLDVLRTVILLATALALMFSMNMTLAWVCAAFIPVIMCYSSLFYRRISAQFRVADEAEGDLLADVQESLTAIRVVKAFGREKYEKDKFDNLLDIFTTKWIDLGYTQGFYWGAGDLASMSQVLAVVCVGAWLGAVGRATLGEILAFISYTNMITWPVRQLGRTMSELSKAGVSIRRLREILDSPLERDEVGSKKPDLYDDIYFEHVHFAYGDQPILEDISFHIPKGTVFGILGATGSGKSSIAYLLNRLYDLPQDSGSIRIGSTDIREIERAHLRRGIGLVLQEPFLFSKTVRQNIEIAADENTPSLEMVRESAAIAAVDSNILEFKEGYDTMVGERGVTLSGGQKQRIAIARALMMNSPVLIFDDSTSSVDMETDEKIRRALQESTTGRTVIIISHRISSLMHADQILVLDQGRVSKIGTHSELAAEEGIYQRVYQMQSDANLLVSDADMRQGETETTGTMGGGIHG